MTIEIYTDASVSPDFPHAGYAFWIRSMQLEIQKAGKVNGINDSIKAELACIDEAVKYLLTKEFVPIERISIYTDCIPAIHAIEGKQPEVLFTMTEFVLKHKPGVRLVKDVFRMHHVKAHTKGTDNKSHYNRWCDMMAKDYRQRTDTFEATIYDYSDLLI